MAVLAKIRQRSALMIGVIAFALFAFIAPGLFEKGFSTVSNDVGSINGENISFEEFRQKVDIAEKNTQGSGMTNMQVVNNVWSQEINRILFEEQYKKLGLRIGKDQLLQSFIDNPNVGKNPMFLNEFQMFDKAKFNEYILNIKNTNLDQWQAWLEFEKQIAIFSKEQVYNTMIKAGFIATLNDAKQTYQKENDRVDFDFVPVLYNTIKDDEIEVTDQDLMAFLKKNEKKFMVKETRDIEYVLIEAKPSKEDEEEVKKKILSLLTNRIVYNQALSKDDTLPSFKEANDLEEFVNANSDIRYDSSFIPKKELPKEYADQLFELKKGEVFGPYLFNDFYCITRLVDRKSGGNVRASHILLSYKGAERANPTVTRNKEEAKTKAEELLRQIEAYPASFEQMARDNSNDSSSQNGGDLGYFGPNMMVKPFNDFVFGNSVGKIGLVETVFGYHIIKITEKEDAVRLATVALKLQASEQTNDLVYRNAMTFEVNAEKKDFDIVAKEMDLTTMPINGLQSYDENFQDLGSQRPVVRWVFSKDTKVGDVKKFEISRGSLLVSLKKINKEGLMSLSVAREKYETLLRNDKKAELIKAKMKGETLDEVAKNTGSSVFTADGISLNEGQLPNIGRELKVVGVAYVSEVGKVSQPIIGTLGVYKIKTKLVIKAPELPNYFRYVNKLNEQARLAITGTIAKALEDNAKIKDNRNQFNY